MNKKLIANALHLLFSHYKEQSKWFKRYTVNLSTEDFDATEVEFDAKSYVALVKSHISDGSIKDVEAEINYAPKNLFRDSIKDIKPVGKVQLAFLDMNAARQYRAELVEKYIRDTYFIAAGDMYKLKPSVVKLLDGYGEAFPYRRTADERKSELTAKSFAKYKATSAYKKMCAVIHDVRLLCDPDRFSSKANDDAFADAAAFLVAGNRVLNSFNAAEGYYERMYPPKSYFDRLVLGFVSYHFANDRLDDLVRLYGFNAAEVKAFAQREIERKRGVKAGKGSVRTVDNRADKQDLTQYYTVGAEFTAFSIPKEFVVEIADQSSPMGLKGSTNKAIPFYFGRYMQLYMETQGLKVFERVHYDATLEHIDSLRKTSKRGRKKEAAPNDWIPSGETPAQYLTFDLKDAVYARPATLLFDAMNYYDDPQVRAKVNELGVIVNSLRAKGPERGGRAAVVNLIDKQKLTLEDLEAEMRGQRRGLTLEVEPSKPRALPRIVEDDDINA